VRFLRIFVPKIQCIKVSVRITGEHSKKYFPEIFKLFKVKEKMGQGRNKEGAYKKETKKKVYWCVLEASGRVAFDVNRMMSAPLEEEEQRKRKKKTDFLRTRWKLPLRRRTASMWGSRDRRKSLVLSSIAIKPLRLRKTLVSVRHDFAERNANVKLHSVWCQQYLLVSIGGRKSL